MSVQAVYRNPQSNDSNHALAGAWYPLKDQIKNKKIDIRSTGDSGISIRSPLSTNSSPIHHPSLTMEFDHISVTSWCLIVVLMICHSQAVWWILLSYAYSCSKCATREKKNQYHSISTGNYMIGHLRLTRINSGNYLDQANIRLGLYDQNGVN